MIVDWSILSTLIGRIRNTRDTQGRETLRKLREYPAHSQTGDHSVSGVRGNSIATGQDSTSTPHQPRHKTSALATVDTNNTTNRELRQFLLKSRTGYRAIFETTAAATVIIDPQGQLVMANRAFTRLSGYSKRDLEGKKYWAGFVDRRDLARVENYHRLRLSDTAGAPREYEFHFIDRAGGTKQVFITADMIPGTDMVLASLIDVTERKRAEDKLQESEQKIRAMFEAAPEGIIVTDLRGTILDTNQCRVRMTGYERREELIGKNITDFALATDRSRMRELLTRVEKEGIGNDIEYTFVRKDGSQFDVEVNVAVIRDREGNPVGLVGISRDVTERKRAELEYKTILRTALDGFWLVDTPRGRFLDVNSTYCSLVGYSREELLTMRIQDIEAAETQEETARHIKSIMQTGQDRFETRHRRKDGGTIDLEVSVNYLPVGGGRLFVFLRDITERKQVEEKLKESEAQYRTIFETTGTATTITEPDGTIFLANAEFARLVGYPKAELENRKNWADFVHKDDIDRVRRNNGLRRRDPSTALRRYEYRIVTRDGSVRDVLVTADLIPGTQRVVTSLLDITERQQAEQKLRESEEFSSSLLNRTPAPMLVVNPDGSIRYANPALEKLTGFTVQELTGCKPPYSWWRPEDSEKLTSTFSQGLAEGRTAEERLYQRRNGEYFWVELTVTPVKDDKGELKYSLSVWLDITERKQAEQKLIESEEFNSSLLQNAPNAMLVINADASVRYVNPELEKLTGFTAKEVIGRKPPYPWWRPEQIEELNRTFTASITERLKAVERLFRRKGGGLFWVEITRTPVKDVNGDLKYNVSIWVDITERKQAEELFRTLTEYSAVGVYIMQDSKFKYVNPQFAKYTGFSAAELLTTDPINLVLAADRDVVLGNAIKIRKNGSSTQQPFEYRIVDKSGKVRWVMEVVTPIIYQGKPAYLASFMDVTEYKNMERKLFEYRELDKVKSDLLSTVSHELRTPLATIKGYTTLLLNYNDRLESGEKLDDLQTIDKAADRLTDLVDHLLDISRLDAGLLKLQKAMTDVSGLLRETVAEARVGTPTHRIVLKSEKGLPVLNIDVRRIRQVLDNLIDNARKYSDEGSEVLIRARRASQEVVISVTDHGVGIPASELDKVFDRMHRVENRLTGKVAGLGLGLSLCKGLVKAHGGRIWMESEEGKGSTCSFTLPLETNG